MTKAQAPLKIELTEVFRVLSKERIKGYLKPKEDPEDYHTAIARYYWNILLSRSFYRPLHLFEVSLRNLLDKIICQDFSDSWLNEGNIKQMPFFSEKVGQEILKADQRAKKRQKGLATRGHIIAELNLGFWVNLLISKNEKSLGIPLVSQFYCKIGKEIGGIQGFRKTSFKILDLRNRVFHYEPICFNQELPDLYKRLVLITNGTLKRQTIFSPALGSFQKVWQNGISQAFNKIEIIRM